MTKKEKRILDFSDLIRRNSLTDGWLWETLTIKWTELFPFFLIDKETDEISENSSRFFFNNYLHIYALYHSCLNKIKNKKKTQRKRKWLRLFFF